MASFGILRMIGARSLLAGALALALAPAACNRGAAAARPDASTSAPGAQAAGVRYLEQVTGGAAANDELPMIIGIHGLGGRPERFERVFAGLGVRARLILPYGLDPWDQGFAWFAAEPTDQAAFARGIQQSADRLAAMIEVLIKTRSTRGRPMVTGFSQGGMLSFALAALHPETVGAAFPLSGMLPSELAPRAAAAGQTRPTVHAFHGVDDARVPIFAARATVARLRAQGFEADLREYPGVGHTVAPEMRADLQAALAAALPRP